MTQPTYSDPSRQPSRVDIAKLSVYGLSILSAGLFLFFPLVNFLHPSPWQRSIGTLHSAAALLATVVAAYTGHLAFPLLRGVSKILPQLRTLTFWSAVLAFLSIASGNIAYLRYRAPAEVGGARIWLKANTPLVHYVFMEFHKFAPLFTLPLAAACAWILWKYGDSILEKQNHAVLAVTAVALMAMMFFAMAALLSGFAIAKVRAL